jgi:hypothetical protein
VVRISVREVRVLYSVRACARTTQCARMARRADQVGTVRVARCPLALSLRLILFSKHRAFHPGLLHFKILPLGSACTLPDVSPLSLDGQMLRRVAPPTDNLTDRLVCTCAPLTIWCPWAPFQKAQLLRALQALESCPDSGSGHALSRVSVHSSTCQMHILY